ncbi:hypothetical protein GGR54DRAFT_515873 [Hypoxylon sp. NC1633]|nr:hypothetical protein GGR54DRAFT_515873 [Hypoxylon sp. NC1633]
MAPAGKKPVRISRKARRPGRAVRRKKVTWGDQGKLDLAMAMLASAVSNGCKPQRGKVKVNWQNVASNLALMGYDVSKDSVNQKYLKDILPHYAKSHPGLFNLLAADDDVGNAAPAGGSATPVHGGLLLPPSNPHSLTPFQQTPLPASGDLIRATDAPTFGADHRGFAPLPSPLHLLPPTLPRNDLAAVPGPLSTTAGGPSTTADPPGFRVNSGMPVLPSGPFSPDPRGLGINLGLSYSPAPVNSVHQYGLVDSPGLASRWVLIARLEIGTNMHGPGEGIHGQTAAYQGGFSSQYGGNQGGFGSQYGGMTVGRSNIVNHDNDEANDTIMGGTSFTPNDGAAPVGNYAGWTSRDAQTPEIEMPDWC